MLCLPVLYAPVAAQAAERVPVGQIVGTYAKEAVRSGQSVGVGVAVIDGDKPVRFFTYGKAIAGGKNPPAQRFASDTLFGIGSVTKVFTTNLLGQAVAQGELDLDTPLEAYETQLGSLRRQMSKVTLKQLADFTGGITDYAPLCSVPKAPPGCMPSSRPTIAQYGGADFANYFAHARPMNHTVSPAVKTRLPAPYYYSDFGVGLLGLLLAKNDTPLANRDVRDWYRQVNGRILRPLGMRNTFLKVPAPKTGLLAGGYAQALADAQVNNGAISDVTLSSRGNFYTTAPRVRIVGGGGKGARAKATISNGVVGGITITNGGSGYIAPPVVLFNNGGSTSTARAKTIVRNGKMIGISVTYGGAGYRQVPDVIIAGGRKGGENATATAHLSNGKVSYISIDEPGSGYVPPVAVVVAPGNPLVSAIPVWAAAGALTSSLEDMAKFAKAAIYNPVGDSVSEGFVIAERPYACQGANPSLRKCPAGTARSGLSWAIQLADRENGIPKIVSKDGGLGGFSTFVTLMPSSRLGVVVFANSRELLLDTGKPSVVSATIANNILRGLHYAKTQASKKR